MSESSNEDNSISSGSSNNEDQIMPLTNRERAQKVHDLVKSISELKLKRVSLRRQLDMVEIDLTCLEEEFGEHSQQFAEASAANIDNSSKKPKTGDRCLMRVAVDRYCQVRVMYERIDGKFCVLDTQNICLEVVPLSLLHRHDECDPVTL